MEVLRAVIADWEACSRDGVIPAESLPEVLDLATSRILDSSAEADLQQDALTLLAREAAAGKEQELKPCLLEAMLLRPSSKSLVCSGGVQFMHFWQAWQELARRLGRSEKEKQREYEPIVEELAIFRDVLARYSSDVGGLTAERLAAAAAAARQMSVDEAAWALLEEALATLTGNSRRPRGMGVLTVRCSCAVLPDEPMDPEDVCKVLLAWLKELARDYCEGTRAGKVRAVQEVCKCAAREACLQLGRNAWDVEKAIFDFCSQACEGRLAVHGQKGSSRGWCSQGAKLRKSEVECPICTEPYHGAQPVMARCCFQVMCAGCEQKLAKQGTFKCPFCRSTDACIPDTHGSTRRTRWSMWRGRRRSWTGRSFSFGSSSGSYDAALSVLREASQATHEARHAANRVERSVEELAVATA